MPHHTFDYYVRSLVTALLSVGIVGAAVYSLLERGSVSAALTGWAGLVLGVYFGAHTTKNGRVSDETPPQPPG